MALARLEQTKQAGRVMGPSTTRARKMRTRSPLKSNLGFRVEPKANPEVVSTRAMINRESRLTRVSSRPGVEAATAVEGRRLSGHQEPGGASARASCSASSAAACAYKALHDTDTLHMKPK